jgi:hypothetical protein
MKEARIDSFFTGMHFLALEEVGGVLQMSFIL